MDTSTDRPTDLWKNNDHYTATVSRPSGSKKGLSRKKSFWWMFLALNLTANCRLCLFQISIQKPWELQFKWIGFYDDDGSISRTLYLITTHIIMYWGHLDQWHDKIIWINHPKKCVGIFSIFILYAIFIVYFLYFSIIFWWQFCDIILFPFNIK